MSGGLAEDLAITIRLVMILAKSGVCRRSRGSAWARVRREMLLILMVLVELGILLIEILLKVRLLVIVLESVVELGSKVSKLRLERAAECNILATRVTW